MDALNSPGTLLRIKRRSTDESFNTLSVQVGRKRRKREEDADEVQFFQFVGRVTEQDAINYEKILDSCMNNDGKRRLMSPGTDASTPKAKRIFSHLQRKRQESPSANVFKVVPAKRQKVDNSVSLDNGEETKNLATSLPRLFDVIPDSTDPQTTKETQQGGTDDSVVFHEDSITCNGIKMTLEKLTVKEPTKKPSDCFYDLYFAPNADFEPLEDMLYVDPVDDEILMYEKEDKELEENYDDEDDSNDENNWRNDYPDEDFDVDSDAEEKCHDSDSSDDLDASHTEYRTRSSRLRFDPYYEENEEYDFEVYDYE